MPCICMTADNILQIIYITVLMLYAIYKYLFDFNQVFDLAEKIFCYASKT